MSVEESHDFRPRGPIERELEAMNTIFQAVKDFNPRQFERMMKWVRERLDEDHAPAAAALPVPRPANFVSFADYEILSTVVARGLIYAIRDCRERGKVGLKEAKDHVDMLVANWLTRHAEQRHRFIWDPKIRWEPCDGGYLGKHKVDDGGIEEAI